MISSCQDAGQDDFLVQELLEINKGKELSEYESKLKELSLFMGEVLKDYEARKELFDFAKLDQNANDIDYNLRLLFERNQNPLSRNHSAIVGAFHQIEETFRAAKDFDTKVMSEFIIRNDIGVLAPYLNELFDFEELTELTIAWWTEEMEEKGLAKDPNWKGEVPGVKISFSNNSGKNYDLLHEVVVNDEYAKKNPTVVFGKFESFEEKIPEDLENNNLHKIENIINSANCSQLTNNSVVRLTMPKFRLTKSIRSFPHPDQIWISVILGTNPGGSAYSYRPFEEVKVTRWNADNDSWKTTPASFIVNNWLDRQVDMAFVVWNKRPSRSQTFTGTVTIKDGEVSTTQTLTIGGWNMTQRHADTYFNRCGTVLDPFRNKGFGTEIHGTVSYGIEKLGHFEFILVPEITL